MPIQQPHTTGNAQVTAGSAIVNGTGTTWALHAVNGGLFTRLGLAVPIAEVLSDTRLRLAYNWPGATGSGAYAIDLARADAAWAEVANRRLAELIAGLSNMSPFGAQLFEAQDPAAVLAALNLISPSEQPFINLMPDSGRGGGRANPLLQGIGGYVGSPFFAAFNGAARSEGGKFIHDNNNYGGTRGALAQTVVDLLVAMERTAVNNYARYGAEFYAERFTAGAGTGGAIAIPGEPAHYLMTTNGSRVIFGAGGFVTYTAWMRTVSGSLALGNSSAEVFKKGVRAQGTQLLKPAEGWTHMRIVSRSFIGYDTAFPNLYATPGTVVEISCPAFFNGRVDPGIHTSPIATINELSN